MGEVPYRELIDSRISDLERRFTELRLEDHRALEKQALEYERRLEILNHSHQEARNVLATYLPRDLHEKDMAILNELRAQVALIWRLGSMVIALFFVIIGLFKLFGA